MVIDLVGKKLTYILQGCKLNIFIVTVMIFLVLIY